MTVPIWGLLPVGVGRMWLVLQVAFVYGAHHTGEKCEISSWRDQAEILAACDSVLGRCPHFSEPHFIIHEKGILTPIPHACEIGEESCTILSAGLGCS